MPNDPDTRPSNADERTTTDHKPKRTWVRKYLGPLLAVGIFVVWITLNYLTAVNPNAELPLSAQVVMTLTMLVLLEYIRGDSVVKLLSNYFGNN